MKSDSAVPAWLGKGWMGALAPGGERGLSILIYHRVLPRKDPLFPDEIDAPEFERHLALAKSCLNVMPLAEAVQHLRRGSLPPRAACITFDDGYADNAEIAMPLLHKHGLHATFFVATGFLDGGRMWNDTIIETVRNARSARLDASALGLGVHALGSVPEKRAAIAALIGALKYVPMAERLVRVGQLVQLVDTTLPDDLMMSTAQLRKLHQGGMAIGGHTVNHPILARLDGATARREIADGKARLEQLLDAPVELFAYPNGKPGADYTAEHVKMVEELGFQGAVSTSWGGAPAGAGVYQLPRFTPWDASAGRFLLRLGRNLRQPASYA